MQWSTFKIDITKVPLVFRISYSWVTKIEICIKYFSDKNFQKRPFCAAPALSIQPKSLNSLLSA